MTYVFWVISMATKSSTLIAAIALATAIGILLWIKNSFGKKAGFLALYFSLLIIMLIFIINSDIILNYFSSWVSDDPNGENRLLIWLSFPDVIKKSFILDLVQECMQWMVM